MNAAVLPTAALLAMSVIPAGQALRTAALLAGLLTAQASGLSEPWQLIPFVPASLIPSPGARMAVFLAAVCAAVLLAGPALPEKPCESTMQEVFTPGSVEWPGTAHLDLSVPVVLLRVPPGTAGPAVLRVEAGGFRDSLPAGYVLSDDRVSVIPRGVSTIRAAGGGLVEIHLSRPPRPFEHPVIHAGPAHADR